ncbi:Uncharacterised protein [Serratia fonticola]|nr:Uncharacterised protein [Serratia fonticola]
MGLDAQVEIYTNELSTGLFIGVQVKTTSRKMESSLSIQIPYKNIKYWGDCEHPVVIVLICLNEDNDMKEPDIYWKHLDMASISLLKRRALKNKNGCASVRFNSDDYLDQIADKPKWVNLWLTDHDNKIIELAKETNLKILKMGLAFDKGNESYLYSTDYFIQDLNIILNEYDKIKYFSQARKRLLDLVPSVKECAESYHKYAQKCLNHFEKIVHSSKGSYDIREDFNDWDDINYTLQKKLKEMIPNYK